ncbi:MAG: BolA family transcriptional regulator [Rhodoferax sp.]
MDASYIEQRIAAGLPCQHIRVEGDGRHWFAVVVCSAFEGLRPVARHQRVYACLGDDLKTDAIHALSIKAFTPTEWAAARSQS